MAMRRNRRSSPAWKIAKKVLLLVVLVAGLRLAWLVVVRGWGTRESVVDVQIQNQGPGEPQGWHAEHRWKSRDHVDDENRYENSNNVQIEAPDIRATANKPPEVKAPPLISTVKHKINDEHSKTSDPKKGDTTLTKSLQSRLKYIKAKTDTGTKSNNTKPYQSLQKGSKFNNTKPTESVQQVVKVTGASERTFNVINSKPVQSRVDTGNCKATTVWGQPYHADASTFDLVKLANYTTDDEGAYSIPIRKLSDIIKDRTQNTVKVILVPFSHADPGYGMTMEGYYTGKSKSTLDNMLVKLVKYPKLTFQWAETVFLARWFEDLDDARKDVVRGLIKKGQLEIVLGGWVMPDEASTTFPAVVDQLIEGHQWLIENLGVKPRNAWVNDPFGYSSTMPYLWKSSGMNNMVFLRIDQPLKAVLMKRKSLEFMWRPYWKRDNSSDLLATLMPYTNYWIADVCGPQPSVCNEFGFINQGYNPKVVGITKDNVQNQSMKLYEQLKITADLFKYNTLYVGLGEDFSFTRGEDWDNLYNNYEKIFEFFSSKPDLKMEIKFGTLAEYFANVRREASKLAKGSGTDGPNAEFPTLSGDFYPYTERKKDYWTGYFSTRPMNKRFSRDIEGMLRAGDVFNVMAYSLFKHFGVNYSAYENVTQNLRVARRELGMFQHHDGITGTSLPFVVEDFEVRLMRGYKAVNDALKAILSSLLSKGKSQTPELLQDESVKQNQTAVIRNLIINSTHGAQLVLVNSLPRKRKQLVSVFVSSTNFNIATPDQSSLPFQITSYPETNRYYRVTFPVELPAFGVDVYRFQPEVGVSVRKSKFEVKEEVKTVGTTEESQYFSIGNDFLTVYFDNRTGMMTKVTDRSGRSTNVTAGFYVYKASNSGAYLFGPAGPASPLVLEKATVRVSRGVLMSEVKVIVQGLFHSVKLYNTTGLQGHGIHITNEIDMDAMNLKESELILRFDTDLQNGKHFFTDQNGYQMMGRETNTSKRIEANYYPISTLAILEDRTRRFNLHSREAHGVASLKSGQIEVMLDRHTMRDDGRGLGQGYFHNVNVNSDFVLQIEHKSSPSEIKELRYTYPTQDSSVINERLQNDILVYSIKDGHQLSLKKLRPLKSTQFPSDVALVGLRNLAKNDLTYNGTSLVLHRRAFECGYQSVTKVTTNNMTLALKNLLPNLKADIVETSLSHLDIKSKLTMNSNIIPDHMELRAFKVDL